MLQLNRWKRKCWLQNKGRYLWHHTSLPYRAPWFPPRDLSTHRPFQDPYGNYVVQYVLGICAREEADKLVNVPLGKVRFNLRITVSLQQSRRLQRKEQTVTSVVTVYTEREWWRICFFLACRRIISNMRRVKDTFHWIVSVASLCSCQWCS